MTFSFLNQCSELPLSWFLGLLALITILGALSIATLVRANRNLRSRKEAVKLERERYERVIEGADEGIWDWNLQSGEVFLSPRLKAMLGRSDEELLGGVLTLESFCHPDDVQMLRDTVLAHLRERKTLSADFRFLRGSGAYRWFRARGRAQWEADNRASYISGSLTDVTSQKKIEATLIYLARARNLEAGGLFWRNLAVHLAENLEMDYVCIDVLEEGNLSATTLAVYNGGQFEENLTYTLKDTPCGALAEKGVCCFPRGVTVLFPADRALRTLRAESYVGTVLWDGGGKPIGLIAVIGRKPLEDVETAQAVLDIVEARAAQELEHTRAEAVRDELEKKLAQTQKLEAVGRLAGGVAHEFNNMLGVILGHAQLALEATGPLSPVAEDLGQIRLAARRSVETASRLLAFARKQAVTPRVVDLNMALSESMPTVRKVLGEEVEVRVSHDPALWKVRLDPAQLELILASLGANSRDAIEGIGSVVVATFNHTLVASEGDAPPGDYAALSFSDDGRGIPSEELGKIFEPFYTTKGVGEGSGLGLSTVHGIVAQNGGFIRVDSEPGRGATFTLYFPMVEEARALADAKAKATAGAAIMIVEDERAILALATKVLTARGYRVFPARTPAEALTLALNPPEGGFDLLITDVVMPEMNGQKLCAEAKKLLPGVRCLYMSGYAADVVALRGILEGEVDFIAKPFELEALCDKVAEVLAR